MSAKLIVGFGNPGLEYVNHRHNVGFRCIDHVSEALDIPYKYEKKKAIFGKKKIKGQEIIILKPQTFSNLSGEAVLYIASFLKVAIKDIFVAYDDIRKDFGTVKIEKNLEKIEHNAIFNLEKALVSNEFIKCGIGIGSKPKNATLEDYYLSDFSEKEEKNLPQMFEKMHELALEFLDLEE